MTTELTKLDFTDLTDQDYVVLGVATCFVRDEGDLKPATILEPVPSASLEALFKGVPTAYKSLHAVTLETALKPESELSLPDVVDSIQRCSDFQPRLISAARTYKAKPEATTLVSLGSHRTDINYSTAKKRILNADTTVRPEDNVKQHEYTHQVL